jgi:WD40 repeat protein
VFLWDAATGKELLQLPIEERLPWYAAFSPDGTRILGFHPGGARAWDISTGHELGRFDEPGRQAQVRNFAAAINRAVFSPDGSRVITLASDRILVWDVATLRPLFPLEGHERRVYTAAFSHDGRLIVTASDDETARLWDAATGEERSTLRGHQGSVRAAVFSPDGRIVATASTDGTARLWQIDLPSAALAHKPRELTPAERKRFEIKEANEP